MDYKEYYEAALAKAERIYESATMLGDITGYDLVEIFPELAESEDERIRKEMVKHFEDALVSRQGVSTSEQVKSWLAWLKSLRPHWKPSEEQMSALLAVLNDPDNIGSQTCQLALNELYDNLKKLKNGAR